MPEQNHGFEVTVPTGKRTVTIFMANVEDQFVGLTLTEREGMNLRRVGVEIHDAEILKTMRDFCDEQLKRNQARGGS